MNFVRVPLALETAQSFVEQHHRHHGRVVGHGLTLEITRLCTDGTKNACSFLYGACAKAAFALGYRRIGTYILAAENGASLRAANWRLIGETKGGSWSRDNRPRTDKHPTQPKLLFEATA